MKNDIILRTVVLFMLPFIMLYAFYVQIHGDYSPGGGFQGGVIFASSMIIYLLIFPGSIKISTKLLQLLAALGVLLYICVGLLSIICNGAFLEYNALLSNKHTAQSLGIMLIEGGVGITIAAAMLLLYLMLSRERNNDS